MIGTTGATVLIIGLLIVSAVLGIVTGGIASLVLRQRWRLWTVLVDGGLGAIVWFIVAYVSGEVDLDYGWMLPYWLTFASAALAVIVVHMVRHWRRRRILSGKHP